MALSSPEWEVQLMLEFLKAPVLVLNFSYYTLLTFLMILFVILLSMLMILPSILSVIRHLICGNNLNWLLNLNLIYETLWTGAGSGLLISMLEKLIWLDQSNNTVAIAVKMDGSVIEEKSSFKMLWLNFSSKLNWAVKLFLLLKLPPRKLKPWFILQTFFLLRLLCISRNLPYTMHGILLSHLGWCP